MSEREDAPILRTVARPPPLGVQEVPIQAIRDVELVGEHEHLAPEETV